MFRLLRIVRPLLRPFIRRMKRLIAEKVDQCIRSEIGLAQMGEFHSDDIFVVGYPKSGNTWFQNLVSGVIYGADPEYAPDTLVQELVPDVHYKRYYKRFRTPMFFKSHHLPSPEYKHVIYLLRDGRDVMVSYFHHLTVLKGEKIDFLKLVQDGDGLFPCKWHEHVEAWLSNPYNARMIIIKYEDLKKNPIVELQRFCAFVGKERDNPFLELTAKKASFEKMRQKEVSDGWDNPKWPKDNFFIRRGQVGSYRDEMPLDVLEAFNHDADDTLHKCGYS